MILKCNYIPHSVMDLNKMTTYIFKYGTLFNIHGICFVSRCNYISSLKSLSSKMFLSEVFSYRLIMFVHRSQGPHRGHKNKIVLPAGAVPGL